MKTFKVLCVNDMAINKWIVTIEALNEKEALEKTKRYGVYPQVAQEVKQDGK